MHIRQQVRNAITKRLKTIKPFKDRVFESRVHPLGKELLPAVLIFSETEIIEPVTKQHLRVVRRLIETAVYVFAKTDDEIENTLDPLAQQVEDLILNDQTLGGIVQQMDLSDTSLLIGDDTDVPVGAARLSFIATVLTKQGDSTKPFVNQGGPFS